jgi:hypothetical protein
MDKNLLLFGFLQLIRYLFPHDYLDIGFSGLQSRLFDLLILLQSVRNYPGKMTIRKLGKNNLEPFTPRVIGFSQGLNRNMIKTPGKFCF